MRLSTAQIYDAGTNGLLRNQYDLYKLQNQMSTGRKVLTPADDPVAASQALITSQKQAVNEQYMENQGNAKDQLAMLESQMKGIGDLLVEVKSRWVEAGNGAYADSELEAIAVDLRQRFDEMLGYANSSDATGLYLFAGFKGNTQPFVNNSGTVQYNGDGGRRQLQVESGRFMDVNYSGADMFEKVMNGNGVFVNDAAAANTGTGVIDNGSVVSAYNGNNFRLEFTRTPDPSFPTDPTKDTVEYSIYEWAPGAAVPGAPTSGPFAYKAGDAIYLPDPTTSSGINVTITGDPATGDSFAVAPSQNQGMFETLNALITTLENGAQGTPDQKARFQNDMMRAGTNIDQAIQHVLDNRAIVGAQLAELDSLSSMGSDLDLQYQTQLSDLQDLDYTAAISELAKNELQLQAAQQSFLKVTSLSLFNFLS